MSDVKIIHANSNRVNRNSTIKLDRLRVAAYCRVSTDSEEQLSSYNSQVTHYKSLVDTNTDWELVDIYADEGISGTQIDKRIEFQRMINDAVEGKIDLILTKSISRFARNTLDTLKYVRLLKEYNVAIQFEKENINTLSMNGEMLLSILSSLAQQESESISANVKMGLKMKMKRGEMVGFNGCLGYDYHSDTKTLTINEEEAEVIRFIFNRYIEGAGAYVIAKELTRLGHKTKRGNSKWHESTVRGIIKNEKYKGDLLLGKTFTVDPITHRRLENFGEEDKFYKSNHHEPIITEELFEEAQKILKKRSRKHNNKGRLDKHSKKYAFSSMIKCGFCGSTAIRRTWHAKSVHQKHVWSCMTSVKEGKKHCPDSKGINEKLIEQAFVDSFNILCSKNRDVIEEFINDMEKSLSKLDKAKEIKNVQNEISTYESKLSKLVDLRINDTINKETYEEKYLELSNKLEGLKNDLSKLQMTIAENNDLKKRISSFRNVFNNNESLVEFDKQVFDSVIEEIIIGKTNDDGTKDPYRITFVFKTGYTSSADGKAVQRSMKKKNKKENMCSYSADEPCGDGLAVN